MKKLKPKALLRVPLQLTFEAGRTQKEIGEIIKFTKGTILKLDDSRKNVIQVRINDRMYAEGKAKRKDGEMYVEITRLLNNGEGY